jgi:mono/diheme cytochrome c family protein
VESYSKKDLLIMAALSLVLGGMTIQRVRNPRPNPGPVAVPMPVNVATAVAAYGTVSEADTAEFASASKLPGYAETKAIEQLPLVDPEQGKRLFLDNCVGCHQNVGLEMPAENTMKIDPEPRDLRLAKDYLYGTGKLAIFRTTKYGIDRTGMAPWKDRLSDDEIWQTVYFVRSLQSQQP